MTALAIWDVVVYRDDQDRERWGQVLGTTSPAAGEPVNRVLIRPDHDTRQPGWSEVHRDVTELVRVIGPVRALSTLQFHVGALMAERPVDDYAGHLVRVSATGTPGPTLCGRERFGPDAPGWSVGGGVSGPNITHPPCPGCVQVAAWRYGTAEIQRGIGRDQLAAAIAQTHADADDRRRRQGTSNDPLTLRLLGQRP